MAIKEARAHKIMSNEFFSGGIGGGTIYRVPKYQRKYVWKDEQWTKLFEDIRDNEEGYFIGTILCVQKDTATPNGYDEYEVIDGQQRLTTISLFLAAIYKTIESYNVKNLNPIQKQLFWQIQNQLTVYIGGQNPQTLLRVFPQKENNNRNDYLYIMGSGTKENADYLSVVNLDQIISVGEINTKNIGNRQIGRAYRFFKTELRSHARKADDKDKAKQLEALFEILSKLNSAMMVRIVAESIVSANVLFEALNNRGVPLTITDLIKNQLLAKLDDVDKKNFDTHYATWEKVIGDDEAKQDLERFFRQTYNAYRSSWDMNLPVARRANLYRGYDSLIKENALRVIEQLAEASNFYKQIQGYDFNNISPDQHNLYADLNRINGATSYTLLLYLLKNRDERKITDNELKKIVNLLIAFFVRHRFTNFPESKALEGIFVDFIDDIRGKKDTDGNFIAGPYFGEKICENLRSKLKSAYESAGAIDNPDDDNDSFKRALRGDVYKGSSSDDNIRFLLVKIAQKYLDPKTQANFWEMKIKKQSATPVWSIEHVLPQTIKKKSPWIKELGCDTLADAQVIQKKYVHKLGNLTLTKYNSELSNLGFLDKRDLTDKKNISIGYKDFLSLNENGLNSYIVAQDVWTPEQINERTELLIKEILEIFAW